MNKTFLLRLGLGILMLGAITSSKSQCLGTAYGTATVAHNGSITLDNQCHFSVEYATFTLTAAAAGDVYVFGSSATSSTVVNTDFITLTDATNTVLATGTGTITYTQPAVPIGTVRIHLAKNATCTSESVCRYPFGYLQAPYAYASSTTTQPTGAVQIGTANVQVVRLDVVVNGNAGTAPTLTSLNLGTGTTTNIADITAARVFYTGTSTTFSTTTQFGSSVVAPASTFTVNGSQQLVTGTNYFWLAYDVSCAATDANVLDGEVFGLTVGSAYVPTITNPAGTRAITTTITTYNTVADGSWSSPATWACGVLPPSATSAISINNNITVSTGGNIAGNVTVAAGKTLTIAAGGTLTMGASSAAAASGNSNKLLTINGTLAVTGGTLNLNGGALFPLSSAFNMSSGTINVDPNDGTSATSYASSSGIFSIQTSTLAVTGGNINFLDPAYTATAGTGQSIIAYSFTTTDAAFGTGCTVTFGGGDDQNVLNVNGFYVEGNISTGTLELGTAVIAGGRFAAQRAVTSRQATTAYITKFRNLTINSGAELVLTAGSAPCSITGNLINNGVITNAAATTGSGFFFADAQYSGGVVFGPITSGQSITGTGFFKKSTADADPTAQTGNLIGGLTMYHSTASAGLTLGMPLTATAFVRMANGKVNTDATNFLALGHGTSLPGNPAVLTASIGTVYGFSATAPTSLATYLPGGWINGTFKRWVNTATTTGQQGILPLGSDTSRPAQILFTAAPSAAGYLVGRWFDPNGGTNGLPLNEPAVTPNSIDKVANGYWQISRDATLAGGTYDATFNNTNTSSVLDYVNTTLIKRVDASSPWVIEGTHVASTGSNNSPIVKRTGLTNLSEFAIGGGTTVIPVELLSFTAQRSAKVNVVNWSTAQEINTSHFILERSIDSRNFTAIAQVTAAGNSNVTRSYNYTDVNPVIGINYYRLKIVDRDNSSRYSWVRNVRNEGSADVAVYPNPVKDVLTVSISADKTGKGNLSITDVSGKLVYNRAVNVAQGINNIPVDMSNVASGAFIIKVQLSDDVVVKKFNKM